MSRARSNYEVNIVNPTDRYRIYALIGKGAYADVYRAYDEIENKDVAIKMISLHDCDDDIEHIQEEIYMQSNLQFPQLTKYYTSYVVGSFLWIVMELLEAGSLADIMNESGPLDEILVAYVMRELLLALEYLHLEGKIHRDVKAGNVLVSMNGTIKLGDFGVTTELNQLLNKKQTRIGSPYWMAPEVIAESTYDESADIWSCGITLLELLHGLPPLHEVTPLRVIYLISTNPSPKLEGPEYSEELKEFLSLCCNKDPKLRLSASQLLLHPYLTQPAAMTMPEIWLSRIIQCVDRRFATEIPVEWTPETIVNSPSADSYVWDFNTNISTKSALTAGYINHNRSFSGAVNMALSIPTSPSYSVKGSAPGHLMTYGGDVSPDRSRSKYMTMGVHSGDMSHGYGESTSKKSLNSVGSSRVDQQRSSSSAQRNLNRSSNSSTGFYRTDTLDSYDRRMHSRKGRPIEVPTDLPPGSFKHGGTTTSERHYQRNSITSTASGVSLGRMSSLGSPISHSPPLPAAYMGQMSSNQSISSPIGRTSSQSSHNTASNNNSNNNNNNNNTNATPHTNISPSTSNYISNNASPTNMSPSISPTKQTITKEQLRKKYMSPLLVQQLPLAPTVRKPIGITNSGKYVYTARSKDSYMDTSRSNINTPTTSVNATSPVNSTTYEDYPYGNKVTSPHGNPSTITTTTNHGSATSSNAGTSNTDEFNEIIRQSLNSLSEKDYISPMTHSDTTTTNSNDNNNNNKLGKSSTSNNSSIPSITGDKPISDKQSQSPDDNTPRRSSYAGYETFRKAALHTLSFGLFTHRSNSTSASPRLPLSSSATSPGQTAEEMTTVVIPPSTLSHENNPVSSSSSSVHDKSMSFHEFTESKHQLPISPSSPLIERHSSPDLRNTALSDSNTSQHTNSPDSPTRKSMLQKFKQSFTKFSSLTYSTYDSKSQHSGNEKSPQIPKLGDSHISDSPLEVSLPDISHVTSADSFAPTSPHVLSSQQTPQQQHPPPYVPPLGTMSRLSLIIDEDKLENAKYNPSDVPLKSSLVQSNIASSRKRVTLEHSYSYDTNTTITNKGNSLSYSPVHTTHHPYISDSNTPNNPSPGYSARQAMMSHHKSYSQNSIMSSVFTSLLPANTTHIIGDGSHSSACSSVSNSPTKEDIKQGYKSSYIAEFTTALSPRSPLDTPYESREGLATPHIPLASRSRDSYIDEHRTSIQQKVNDSSKHYHIPKAPLSGSYLSGQVVNPRISGSRELNVTDVELDLNQMHEQAHQVPSFQAHSSNRMNRVPELLTPGSKYNHLGSNDLKKLSLYHTAPNINGQQFSALLSYRSYSKDSSNNDMYPSHPSTGREGGVGGGGTTGAIYGTLSPSSSSNVPAGSPHHLFRTFSNDHGLIRTTSTPSPRTTSNFMQSPLKLNLNSPRHLVQMKLPSGVTKTSNHFKLINVLLNAYEYDTDETQFLGKLLKSCKENVLVDSTYPLSSPYSARPPAQNIDDTKLSSGVLSPQSNRVAKPEHSEYYVSVIRPTLLALFEKVNIPATTTTTTTPNDIGLKAGVTSTAYTPRMTSPHTVPYDSFDIHDISRQNSNETNTSSFRYDSSNASTGMPHSIHNMSTIEECKSSDIHIIPETATRPPTTIHSPISPNSSTLIDNDVIHTVLSHDNMNRPLSTSTLQDSVIKKTMTTSSKMTNSATTDGSKEATSGSNHGDGHVPSYDVNTRTKQQKQRIVYLYELLCACLIGLDIETKGELIGEFVTMISACMSDELDEHDDEEGLGEGVVENEEDEDGLDMGEGSNEDITAETTEYYTEETA